MPSGMPLSAATWAFGAPMPLRVSRMRVGPSLVKSDPVVV
jgi:hypothetical protein